MVEKIRKFSKQNNTSLENSLFSIGKELSGSKAGGRIVSSSLSTVQVPAKSRRDYKHRGRVVGNIGRRPRTKNKNRESDGCGRKCLSYSSQTEKSEREKKQLHSLNDAVNSNRPGAKKH